MCYAFHLLKLHPCKNTENLIKLKENKHFHHRPVGTKTCYHMQMQETATA